MWSVHNRSLSPPTTSRTMPRRATQTSRSAAHRADRHGAARVPASAAGTIEALARCIPSLVRNAARMRRSRSCPVVTVRSIVVIATTDGAGKPPTRAGTRPSMRGGREHRHPLITKSKTYGRVAGLLWQLRAGTQLYASASDGGGSSFIAASTLRPSSSSRSPMPTTTEDWHTLTLGNTKT